MLVEAESRLSLRHQCKLHPPQLPLVLLPTNYPLCLKLQRWLDQLVHKLQHTPTDQLCSAHKQLTQLCTNITSSWCRIFNQTPWANSNHVRACKWRFWSRFPAMPPQKGYCWWFRYAGKQLRLVVCTLVCRIWYSTPRKYPIIYRVLYIPGGDRRISEPSTVSPPPKIEILPTMDPWGERWYMYRSRNEKSKINDLYVYLEPKWPLFWLEFRPCFGGEKTFKNRGHGWVPGIKKG